MSAHIQVELGALNMAAAIANAAKIERQWVIAGLNDMWAYCFREHTDTIPTVFITGWFSEPIGPVLEAFGFVEQIDEKTWRVKGTGRYASLTEKRKAAGSKGGMVTATARAAKINGATVAIDAHRGVSVEDRSKNDVGAAKINGATEARDERGRFAQANTQQKPDKPKQIQASAQANGQANAQNTVAKAALKPRSENSPLRGELSTHAARAPASHAHTRVQEPDPPPLVASALARWQQHLAQLVPHAMVDDASLLTVARDFSTEVFARGVERHVDDGPQFWVKTPVRFLRLRCEWERDRPPPERKPSVRKAGELSRINYPPDAPRVIGTLR